MTQGSEFGLIVLVTSLLDELKHYRHEWPEDAFTLDPELIFEQAAAFETVQMTLNDGCDHWFTLFGRVARVSPVDGIAPDEDGMVVGREVVAYLSDAKGNVFDWEKRYEETGVDFVAVCNKLRIKLANGLAILSNYEGSLADIAQ
jgi:hypothetical protein